MVYTTLKVVLGFVINKAELLELLEMKGEDDNLREYDIVKLFDDLDYGKNINLYRFPCCSESSNELFIIGIERHKYYRQPVRCHDCQQYTVCDRCIGHTNNGYYDVCAIFQRPIEVNVRHVCPWCFHDNKQDLNGPQTTSPIVDRRFQPNDYNHSDSKQCNVCSGRPGEFRCPKDHMKFHHSGYYNKLNSIQEDFDWKKSIELYYILNDCLSCT